VENPKFRSTKVEESRSGNGKDLSAFNELQSFCDGNHGSITGESFKSDLNNISANNTMSTNHLPQKEKRLVMLRIDKAKRQYWNKTKTIMQKKTFKLTSIGKNTLDNVR